MTGLELLVVQLRIQLGTYEKLRLSLPSAHLDGVIEGFKEAIQLAESAKKWGEEL